jgi:hypothetical protein
VHEAVVAKLIASAAEKLYDARGEARQIPDDLAGVRRAEIEAALKLTEASLKADVAELRGDVAAAHAFIRRCRFPRDEHRGLFGALAELRFALEEIEDAAAAFDYPESSTSIPLPRQHVVPRGALASALDVLESRLNDFDQKLADLEQQQSGDSDHEDQMLSSNMSPRMPEPKAWWHASWQRSGKSIFVASPMSSKAWDASSQLSSRPWRRRLRA